MRLRGAQAGVFGVVFTDAGPVHTVLDANGEDPVVCVVASVSQVAACTRVPGLGRGGGALMRRRRGSRRW